MSRPHDPSAARPHRHLPRGLSRILGRLVVLAIVLSFVYVLALLTRPAFLFRPAEPERQATALPQSGCETARNCTGTLLDRHVYLKHDAEFRWKDTGQRMRGREKGGRWTGYILEVTLHRWLNRSATNRHVWWHFMTLMAPDRMSRAHKGVVLFFVGAGWSMHNKLLLPNKDEGFFRLAAPLVVDLGILGVMLDQVPMMPIDFYMGPPGVGKAVKLQEEQIMAHATAMFLENPSDYEWAMEFPMVKSVVRGFDVAQLATRALLPYVPRVVGIISYGYDFFSMVASYRHMFRSLGGWPILLRFHVEYNITLKIFQPQFNRFMELVDAHSYRERLTMPKLIVSAANDEFFALDDSYNYWEGLPEPKFLKLLPNIDHMVLHSSQWGYDACISFFLALLHDTSSCAALPPSSRPSLTWLPPNASSPSSSHQPSSSPPSSSNPTDTSSSSSIGRAGLFSLALGGRPAAPPLLLPWTCSPLLTHVLWPKLTWRFDWPSYTIHATSEVKPVAVQAWTGKTFMGSKRRDFRFILHQGRTGW
ncbi:unnamed protein product [Closterium sp. Naga37s-1]|nr:unnamed protein product [Closterium sp. Naga37s-1]